MMCVYAKLIAKTMNRKHLDTDSVSSSGIKSATAKTLFPNIASVPAVSAEDLVQQNVSRKSTAHTGI